MVLSSTVDGNRVCYDAPAKINLALHVTGQRHDGYHLLDSLVVRANFGDRLLIQRGETDGFSVSGPFAAELAGHDVADNLIVKARAQLRALGYGGFGVDITLEKNLPVASGVGGGSADAAAALLALAEQWRLNMPAGQMHAIALGLGADVPMCLNLAPMRVRGIGDEVTTLSTVPDLAVVAVNPGIGVATPTVFNAMRKKDNPPIDLPTDGWRDADAFIGWLAAQTRNDLYAPAVAHCPAIDAVLNGLRHHNAQLARMSGSGATCFGVFSNDEDARQAAAAIKQAHADWYVQAGRTLGNQATQHEEP